MISPSAKSASNLWTHIEGGIPKKEQLEDVAIISDDDSSSADEDLHRASQDKICNLIKSAKSKCKQMTFNVTSVGGQQKNLTDTVMQTNKTDRNMLKIDTNTVISNSRPKSNSLPCEMDENNFQLSSRRSMVATDIIEESSDLSETCPICNVPLHALRDITPGRHVNECLDGQLNLEKVQNGHKYSQTTPSKSTLTSSVKYLIDVPDDLLSPSPLDLTSLSPSLAPSNSYKKTLRHSIAQVSKINQQKLTPTKRSAVQSNLTSYLMPSPSKRAKESTEEKASCRTIKNTGNCSKNLTKYSSPTKQHNEHNTNEIKHNSNLIEESKKPQQPMKSITNFLKWNSAASVVAKNKKSVTKESSSTSLSTVIPSTSKTRIDSASSAEPGARHKTRTCPFYKKIPGTGFTVDAFRYGSVEGCTAYLLSHFHYDHYGGLSKKFKGTIYTSQATANLVVSELRVDRAQVMTLPIEQWTTVENVQIMLLDANHCPGSVLFLLQFPSGKRILHTGDFRAETVCERYPILTEKPIDTVYLDTTYCNPQYAFAPQAEVIRHVVDTCRSVLEWEPKTLFCCGSYTIGKEKVFQALATEFGLKVGVTKRKMKVLQCIGDKQLSVILSTDLMKCQIHVVDMKTISYKGLQEHFSKYSCSYKRLVAIKPTGWTHSEKIQRLTDIRPQTRGSISIYNVPYSEHSSYKELQEFIGRVRPSRIIPTVNIGSPQSREKMNQIFKKWKEDENRN